MNLDYFLKNGDSKPYEGIFRWKKRLALVTTSLTVFVIICIFVSQSIHDFNSVAYIDLSSQGSVPEKVIHQIIGEELTDSKLTSHFAAAHTNSGAMASSSFTERELAAIRDSFNFQIKHQSEHNRHRLTAEYRGAGTRLEQLLTEQVVGSINSRLKTLQVDRSSFQQLTMQLETALDNIERNSSARHSELTAAHSMIDRLNEGLSDIHNQVEFFRPLPATADDSVNQSIAPLDDQTVAQLTGLLNALQLRLQNIERSADGPNGSKIEQAASEFRNQLNRISPLLKNADSDSNVGKSPMRVVNALLPEQSSHTVTILNSLNELDTDNLQSKLGQVQQNLRNDAIQIRNDIAAIDSLARELSENRIVVLSMSNVRTQPSNPLPGWSSLLLFALAAIGVGVAITLFYRPEQEGIGFATSESVSEALGLPIVAELKPASVANERAAGIHAIANSIVGHAQIMLFGFGLLVVLLCLLHSDLRRAFVENPIFGLARLFGMFFGN